MWEKMARSGANAEMHTRIEELEVMEAARAGRSGTATSINADVGRVSTSGSGQLPQPPLQQSPVPSTASTPTSRISQVAPFQVGSLFLLFSDEVLFSISYPCDLLPTWHAHVSR